MTQSPGVEVRLWTTASSPLPSAGRRQGREMGRELITINIAYFKSILNEEEVKNQPLGFPRSKALGSVRVDTEQRIWPRLKGQGLAPTKYQIFPLRRAGIFSMMSVAIKDFSPISWAPSSPAIPWR